MCVSVAQGKHCFLCCWYLLCSPLLFEALLSPSLLYFGKSQVSAAFYGNCVQGDCVGGNMKGRNLKCVRHTVHWATFGGSPRALWLQTAGTTREIRGTKSIKYTKWRCADVLFPICYNDATIWATLHFYGNICFLCHKIDMNVPFKPYENGVQPTFAA